MSQPAPEPAFGLSVSRAAPAPPPPQAGPARAEPGLDALVEGVRRADRAILGRAISLVESTHPDHAQKADALLRALLPHTGRSMRLGITGVPGAGKSTSIERLGTTLTASGSRVAVLAVDPSSGVSGGSILGDKTRMPRLSADPHAFVRPSPSGGALGGVTRRTRETMLLCEAAGFDVVLVETVGVGQSETTVAGMTDFFLAVFIAGAGDELQGIKRGLLELVDLIAINKADGDNEPRARQAASRLASAVRLIARRDPAWPVPVIACSALTGVGVGDIWEKARSRVEALRASGELDRRRRDQDLRWLHELIDEKARALLRSAPGAMEAMRRAEEEVRLGRRTPAAAADAVVRAWLASLRDPTLYHPSAPPEASP